MHGSLSTQTIMAAALAGLLGGLLALLLTMAVYAAEDAFQRLPIHWMWWPSLGGLVVGLGGLFQPRALGVGYEIIEQLLKGEYVPAALIGLIVVKAIIWSTSLGSGTSGGVLAPLLIMGGALGAMLSPFLPGGDAALWPLVGMAAALGGTMRSPLTGAVFALELTHDVKTLPALLASSVMAYAFTVLVMKRSILTEKLARRGYHVQREYSVDPLERITAGEVMTTEVVTVAASMPLRELVRDYFSTSGRNHHAGYPVLGRDAKFLGIVAQSHLLDYWLRATNASDNGAGSPGVDPIIAYDLMDTVPILAYPDDTCREVAERLAGSAQKRVPVVSREDPTKLLGIVSLSDLLKARERAGHDEAKRERFYGFPERSKSQDEVNLAAQ